MCQDALGPAPAFLSRLLPISPNLQFLSSNLYSDMSQLMAIFISRLECSWPSTTFFGTWAMNSCFRSQFRKTRYIGQCRSKASSAKCFVTKEYVSRVSIVTISFLSIGPARSKDCGISFEFMQAIISKWEAARKSHYWICPNEISHIIATGLLIL